MTNPHKEYVETAGSAKNAKEVKTANRRKVFRLICLNGPISRAAITRTVGLTKMTVTNVVQDLFAQNIICEQKMELCNNKFVGMGRVPMLVELAADSPCIIGIYVGRSICNVSVYDLSGNTICGDEQRYPADLDEKKLADTIISMYNKVSADTSRKIIGIGISAFGPVDSIEGKLLNPINFYGIHDFELSKILEQATGHRVSMLSCGEAAALTEKMYGKEDHGESFMFVHVDDTVSMGMILSGVLPRKNHGPRGGLSHMCVKFDGPECECGNKGCLQQYVSTRQLAKIVMNRKGGQKELTWSEIVINANNGDEDCVYALEQFAYYLAIALANCMNLMDFNEVVLGYYCSEIDELIPAMVQKNLDNMRFSKGYRNVPVAKSHMGKDTVIKGAMAVAAQAVFEGEIPLLEY